MTDRLSLSKAISSNRLEDFVRQCEADKLPAADIDELENAFVRTIKPQQSTNQTSRSPSRDDSSEK